MNASIALLWRRRRGVALAALALALYGVIAGELWRQQISRGADYAERLKLQSARRVRVPALRGRILTADNRVLAECKPRYDIVFHPSEMRAPGPRRHTVLRILEAADAVAAAIGRVRSLTRDAVERHINLTPAMPLKAFGDLSGEEMARLADIPVPIRGLEVAVSPVRHYPGGPMACHVIGYVGLDDPGGAEDRREFSYYVPDMRGRSGVERAFDLAAAPGVPGLRGRAGDRIVMVDARGFAYEDSGLGDEPEDGMDIVLTLSWTAQKAAEEAIRGYSAAIVVLDACDGGVIALASHPGFDLAPLADGISLAEWNALISNPEKPLLNRAAMAEYMPGSIVKPLVALASLGAGIGPDAIIVCDGASTIGDAKIRCWSWKYGGHGPIGLLKALEQSCNVYFIEAGRKAGLDRLLEVYKSAGIGSATGYPLPERKGMLPSRERKRKTSRSPWNEYDTSLVCIGQGMITITPLQGAVFAAALANGGAVVRPALLAEARPPRGGTPFRPPPSPPGRLAASPEHIALVREGMRLVVNSDDGTGAKARTSRVTLYGKTGTAQVGPPDRRIRQTWFIGFFDEPRSGRTVALAVAVENGESGGRTAAPMAKAFIEGWLDSMDGAASPAGAPAAAL